MELAVRRKGPEGNAPMSALKRFSSYKRETDKASRKAVVESDAVRRILDSWNDVRIKDVNDSSRNYEMIVRSIRGIEYTTEDIMRFSLALTDFQDEKGFSERAGFFLSALINEGKDAEYVINVEHLPGQIDNLGQENRKIVTVIGDLGDYTGDSMKGGILTVKGNVGDLAGFCMEEGELRIEGSADDSVGSSMEGGRITVAESCGDDTAESMRGGELVIEGDVYGSIGYMMEGGVITVNGDVVIELKPTVKKKESYSGTCGVWMRGGEIHFNGRCYIREANVINGKIYRNGKLVVNK
jgi:formylmethanofuran dehydrogenase subunit C